MVKELKVLDYNDVLLYKRDMDLLIGDHWLNDQVLHIPSQISSEIPLSFVRIRTKDVFCIQIIAFFFEYLQMEKYVNSTELLFCGGSLTYLLVHGTHLPIVFSLLNNAPDQYHFRFPISLHVVQIRLLWML